MEEAKGNEKYLKDFQIRKILNVIPKIMCVILLLQGYFALGPMEPLGSRIPNEEKVETRIIAIEHKSNSSYPEYNYIEENFILSADFWVKGPTAFYRRSSHTKESFDFTFTHNLINQTLMDNVQMNIYGG